MDEHSIDDYPALAHALVLADAPRVRALASRYAEMATLVSSRGVDAPESAAAQLALLRLLSDWARLDHEAELRDMVQLEGDELDETRRGLRLALEYVELVEDDQRGEVEAALRRALGRLGPMPRVWILSLRRCLRRLHRLRELDGPAIILANEARLIAQQLEVWKTPPVPWSGPVDWSYGCAHLLRIGVCAATNVDSSGHRGVDRGLGRTRAAVEILGLQEDWPDPLLDASQTLDGPALESVLPALGAAPLVPYRRFHELGPSFTAVRDHGESVGPIGWADGDDLARLATAYDALARAHPPHGRALAGVARSLRAAQRDDRAVLGCLELLTYESDGRRSWLVGPDGEEG